MKKIFLCVFFIIVITRAVAENLFDFSWNFGNLGIEVNYSGSDDDDIEFSVLFLNFIIEQKDINISFEFSPVKYWHSLIENELETKNKGERFSLLNANIYWDLLRNSNIYLDLIRNTHIYRDLFGNSNILLGPFASLNYLFVNSLSGVNMNECVFSGGLRFSFKTKHIIISNNYNDQIFCAEIGYRNLFGSNKFYFSINIDLILGIMGITDVTGMGIAGEAKKDIR
jgi:hypothetical protein